LGKLLSIFTVTLVLLKGEELLVHKRQQGWVAALLIGETGMDIK
jgi:hypothetical protein